MLHALLFLQSSLGSCLTLRGGSGQDIGRAMSACSEAGGGTVRLSAGNFSLFSATDLAPSILLSGLSNVNLAGDGALDAPCASHSSRLILQDLAAGFKFYASAGGRVCHGDQQAGRGNTCFRRPPFCAQ